MTGSSIPLQILRLTEAFIYASSAPVTPSALSPLLPDHLDPVDVLEALERHCAGRGVVLFESGGHWTFRTAPDLGIELQGVEKSWSDDRLPAMLGFHRRGRA